MKNRYTRIALVLNIRNIRAMRRYIGIIRYIKKLPDTIIDAFSMHDLQTIQAIKTFGKQGYSGIIASDISTEKFASFHKKFNLPVVYFNPSGAPVDSVTQFTPDWRAIASTTVDYLARRGVTNFAYVGTHHLSELEEREICNCFIREEAERIHGEFFNYLPKPFNRYSILAESNDAFGAWLKSLPKPCGIIAHDFVVAKHVIDNARLSGITIPEQLMVIGLEDSPAIAENLSPTISCLNFDHEQQGHQAADLLIKLITSRKSPAQTIVFRPIGIIERESTSPAHGTARLISLAKQFIRNHAEEKINVNDVAARIGVSRRLLEMRFAEAGNGTIHDAIREARLDNVAKLLRNTDLPISEIAYRSGYRSNNILRTIFKQHFGCTMSEMRAGQNPD